MWKKSKQIKATVRASDIHDSTIIGYQVGLDADGVKNLFDEGNQKMQEFFAATLEDALNERLSALLERPKPLLSSLYVCESLTSEDGERKSLGFAINNSGLLVTTAAVGTVASAMNIATGLKVTASTAERGAILQLAQVPAPTVGVVPAYLTAWGEDEINMESTWRGTLYAFDESGLRRALRVTNWVTKRWSSRPLNYLFSFLPGLGQQFVEVDGFANSEDHSWIQGLVECEHDGTDPLLMGGPVFTDHDEVCGILLLRTLSTNLVWFAAWANVDIDELTTAKVIRS